MEAALFILMSLPHPIGFIGEYRLADGAEETNRPGCARKLPKNRGGFHAWKPPVD
jgi:hypothetical protein